MRKATAYGKPFRHNTGVKQTDRHPASQSSFISFIYATLNQSVRLKGKNGQCYLFQLLPLNIRTLLLKHDVEYATFIKLLTVYGFASEA